MGVRRLTRYLKNLEKEGKEPWESCELKETDLIIDGSGLCFYFYENPHCPLNRQYGGEYSQLEKKVKEFFEKLHSDEVRRPYIVFDGIMEGDKKLDTTLRRKTERIGKDQNDLQPSLTKQIILQVLEERQVPYVVPDFDADSDIASLANKKECPVMANDSDFLIFDIKQGYIPFNSYNFSDPAPGVNVKRFYRKKVAEVLGIKPALLPLLASLVGNDYVSEDMLKPFKESYGKMSDNSPQNIAEFLSKYDSPAEAMTNVLKIIPEQQKRQFQETINNSVEQYQTNENNLHIHNYFERGLHSSDLNFKREYKEFTPQKIIKLYRRGKFAKQCMSIMCQGRVFLGTQNTPIKCTEPIRTNVYKILMPSADKSTTHELTEYCGDGSNYGSQSISIETQANDWSIDTIESTSEEDKVIYLLQTTLSCELEFLKDISNEWWLVVAILRYWYKNARNKQVTETHLEALLLYQVNNAVKEHEDLQQLQEPDPGQSFPEPDKEILKRFLLWQDVVYWVDILYSLLGINSLPVLRPAKLYDGEKVWNLYTKLHNGVQAVEIVTDVRLFKQLCDTALKDIPSWDQNFSQVRRSKGKSRVSKKPKAVKPEQENKEFLKLENSFAPLSRSSESDEEG